MWRDDSPEAVAGQAWSDDLLEARAAGELLMQVAYESDAMISAAAVAEGLTAKEARVLRYVHEALPQHELGKRMGMDPARVTVMLRSLEQRGLVSRSTWVDRRVRLVSITPEGIAVSDRVGLRIAETSRLVHALTDRERQQLLKLLQKLLP